MEIDRHEIDVLEAERISRLKESSQLSISDPDSWLQEEVRRNIFLTTVD